MSVTENGIKFVSYTFSTALAALGDTIRISVKVKNTSGSALNSVNSYLFYDPAAVPSNFHPMVRIYPEQGRVTSIASGATKTYDFDVTLTKDWGSYSVLQDGRLPGDYTSGRAAFMFTFGSGSYSLSIQDDFSDMRSKGLTIFYERVKPTITAGCVRSVATGAVNDEGEYLLTRISATCPKTAAELAAGGYPTVPTVKYSTSEETIRAGGGDAMTVGDNMNIGAMLTGIAEYTMVGGVPTPSASITGVSDRVIRNHLSNVNNYYISITFDDPYEPVVLYLSAPRAFANVHLSGASTGGVALGKFSAATEDNPLFECMYPAKLYGGMMNVQTGIVDFGTISANGSKNISVTFEHEYASAPIVLMNPYASSSSNSAVAKMPVHAGNDSVTATGFTARCVNGDSSAHAMKGTWLAFGIPKQQ